MAHNEAGPDHGSPRAPVRRPVRLGLVAAQPVYYQAPLYQRLARDPRLDFTVVFISSEGVRPFDHGHGALFDAKIDVLEGYRSVFLPGADRNPAAGSFAALRDPGIVLAIWREHFDVLWIHGYYYVAFAAAAVTQRLRGGRLMFREEQNLLLPRPWWKQTIKAAWLRMLFAGASALCIGTGNDAWFAKYGIPRERRFSVPYVVDNERFQSASRALHDRKAELRAGLGIDPAAGPVVVSVGRLIPAKQPLRLLEAFRRLRSQQRCTLLIVGGGPLEADLKAAVERDGIPDVHFAGLLDQHQIMEAYAAADIFALFSYSEPWGLVLNEAMNFGLPVVISDHVGAGLDLVADGVNGYVVPFDDIDILSDRLARLVGDADLRARMGAASLERITPWNHDRAARGVIEATAAAVGARRWTEAGPAPGSD